MIDSTAPRAALLLAALACTTACVGMRFDVETVYVIEDLDAATQERLRAELQRELRGDGFVVVDEAPDGGRFEFRLTRAASSLTVRRVRSVIESVGRDGQRKF